MIGRWFRGRYTEEMEDPKKVQDKVGELNNKYKPGLWVPIAGNVSLMDAELKNRKEVVFNASIGYVLKAFVNTKTAEVKLFAAGEFFGEEKD